MGASKSRERPDYFKQLQIYHLPEQELGLDNRLAGGGESYGRLRSPQFGARREMGDSRCFDIG
jgi:hypothetical protein